MWVVVILEQGFNHLIILIILEQGFNPSTLWWTIYSSYSSTSVVHTERLNGKYDQPCNL